MCIEYVRYTGLAGSNDADEHRDEQLRHLQQQGISQASAGFIFVFRNHADNRLLDSSSFSSHHDHDHVWQVVAGSTAAAAVLLSKYRNLPGRSFAALDDGEALLHATTKAGYNE